MRYKVYVRTEKWQEKHPRYWEDGSYEIVKEFDSEMEMEEYLARLNPSFIGFLLNNNSYKVCKVENGVEKAYRFAKWTGR